MITLFANALIIISCLMPISLSSAMQPSIKTGYQSINYTSTTYPDGMYDIHVISTSNNASCPIIYLRFDNADGTTPTVVTSNITGKENILQALIDAYAIDRSSSDAVFNNLNFFAYHVVNNLPMTPNRYTISLHLALTIIGIESYLEKRQPEYRSLLLSWIDNEAQCNNLPAQLR